MLVKPRVGQDGVKEEVGQVRLGLFLVRRSTYQLNSGYKDERNT